MTAPVIRGNGIPSEASFAFDGTIAVAVGDLLYHDSNDVKPFSSLADQLSAGANKAYAAKRFAGVAGDARLVGDTAAVARFRVLTDVVAEYDCESSTFEIGDMVAPSEDSGADGLENQKVAKTLLPEQSIGTVVQRYGSATTRVLVRLKANVLPHGNTADGGKIQAITERLLFSGFTDGGGTSGYKDLATQVPAGALILGWRAEVLTGFTGDTTAVIQVGTSADADRFSSVTTNSVLAAGTVGSQTKDGVLAFCSAATTVRVTVTGGADFTAVAAGEMNVTLQYIL